VINAVLFGVKFWAGMITGSIALIADAWHTLSDSLTSIFVIFSARLSSRKPDKQHPFGHGRWEQISSIFIAFILGVIAYDFFINSIERLKNRESVVFGTLAIVVTAVSILVKELLAQYAFYVGRKTDNVIVKADGWHHRSDALSSIVVLIGIIITKFTTDLWWMDSVLGIFCALAIFYAAYEILKESINKLLGEEPTQELIDKINIEVKKLYSNDLHIHHLHLHNYVSQKEITMHIRLDKNMTIDNGHKIATDIENMIKDQFDMAATIHIEPLDKQQDDELQQKLINVFVKNNHNAFNDLAAALAAGDIKRAHMLAHTLRSNAAQLDKIPLQKAAADIEKQLKTGENCIAPEMIAVLKSEFNRVMDELSPLVSETVRFAAKELADKDAAIKLLEELEPMLKTGNINCLAHIDGLLLIPGSEELIQNMEDYSFKQALKSLFILKEKILLI